MDNYLSEQNMKTKSADPFQHGNMLYPIMSQEVMLIHHPEATVKEAEGPVQFTKPVTTAAS